MRAMLAKSRDEETPLPRNEWLKSSRVMRNRDLNTRITLELFNHEMPQKTSATSNNYFPVGKTCFEGIHARDVSKKPRRRDTFAAKRALSYKGRPLQTFLSLR